MKINPYLNYGGRCEEAFRFYEKHLGGKNLRMMKWKDMPGGAQHCPPGWESKVLHAYMEIGETVLMASDVPGFEPMRSFYLSLAVSSDEEAERIYALLADGGEVYMKMEQTFFAHRFGQLRDRFGTLWMVIHQRPMPGA
jgi:PhnB protein